MDTFDTFKQFFLTTVWIFLLLSFLMVLFYIFADIFRDHTMGGFSKALWIIFLILFPPLVALLYLIFRGSGMQQRSLARAQQARDAQHEYIRQVVAVDPAEQIARAQQLREQGVISEAEFQSLKAKALA